MEEKYRKAMVSNAQLDNEKNNLMYQVDTLKDSLMELEELLSESQRGYEEKVKVGLSRRFQLRNLWKPAGGRAVSCVLTGTGEREACPRRAPVSVHRDQRDAQTKRRAAKRE